MKHGRWSPQVGLRPRHKPRLHRAITTD